MRGSCMNLLDEQNIGMSGSRHVADSVAAEEDEWGVGQISVRQDRLALVMTVMVVGVSVDELPSITLLVGIGEYYFVGNDVDLAGLLLANQFREDASNDGDHSGRYYDDRDVVLFGVGIEVLEARVKGDVWDERSDSVAKCSDQAMNKRRQSAEGVSKGEAFGCKIRTVDHAPRRTSSSISLKGRLTDSSMVRKPSW